jgi:hypothetical protein
MVYGGGVMDGRGCGGLSSEGKRSYSKDEGGKGLDFHVGSSLAWLGWWEGF